MLFEIFNKLIVASYGLFSFFIHGYDLEWQRFCIYYST